MALDWETLESVCVGSHSRHIVGGFTVFPKDFWCELVFWRKSSGEEEPAKDEKLTYRYEGWPLRDDKDWKGKIEADGNKADFAGKGKNGLVTINDLAYPVEVITPWFSQPRIDFSFKGQEWAAVFPKMLMTEADRESDRFVRFQTGQSAFQLCIFPKEEYIEHFNPYDKRPTAIAAGTRSVAENTAALPHNGSDFPLLCFTIGLLGFEIFG